MKLGYTPLLEVGDDCLLVLIAVSILTGYTVGHSIDEAWAGTLRFWSCFVIFGDFGVNGC